MVQAPVRAPFQLLNHPVADPSPSEGVEQNAARIDGFSIVVLDGSFPNNPAPTLIGRLCCSPEECAISAQTCLYSTVFGLIVGALVVGVFDVYNQSKGEIDTIPLSKQATVIVGMVVIASVISASCINECRRRGHVWY